MCVILYLVNMQYGIINMQMLIKFNKHLNNLFRNLNITEMASLLNKTIKIILSNYIPEKTTICNDKDPPWITNNIIK